MNAAIPISPKVSRLTCGLRNGSSFLIKFISRCAPAAYPQTPWMKFLPLHLGFYVGICDGWWRTYWYRIIKTLRGFRLSYTMTLPVAREHESNRSFCALSQTFFWRASISPSRSSISCSRFTSAGLRCLVSQLAFDFDSRSSARRRFFVSSSVFAFSMREVYSRPIKKPSKRCVPAHNPGRHPVTCRAGLRRPWPDSCPTEYSWLRCCRCPDSTLRRASRCRGCP